MIVLKICTLFVYLPVSITPVMSAVILHDISYHQNSTVTCIAKNFTQQLACLYQKSAVYDNHDM